VQRAAQLQVLGREQGLGPLAPMQVAAYRSKASRGMRPWTNWSACWCRRCAWRAV
jgi:hypothetical protein